MQRTATATQPPFLPSDRQTTRSVTRFATAVVLGHLRNCPVETAAVEGWSHDRGLEALLETRGAVGPATMTGATWAGPLVVSSIADFIRSLSPVSASSKVIGAGIRVDLLGYGSISVPGMVSPEPQFVGEGMPIGVIQPVTSGAVVGPPAKLAAICGFSSTLSEYSTPTIERLIEVAVTEACGKALDRAIFSDTAAAPERPGGILAGTAPIAAALGGGIGAAMKDVSAIVAAIVANGGGQQIWLITDVGSATRLSMLLPASFALPIVPSAVMAPGTLIGLDVAAFCSGFGSVPTFDISRETVLHMDTSPQNIEVAGSATAPAQSMFQTDSVALRMILPVAFALRGVGLAQSVSGVSW